MGISALTAGVTAGVGGGINQLANSSVGWAKTAQSAIQSVGEVGTKWGTSLAVGAYYGAVGYTSSYVANQVFGNKQQFSWSSLGASVVGSMAGASLGRTGVFDGLGKTASPYAYGLTGANTAAAIEDKWFGGARPDYVNVSMGAIANVVGSNAAKMLGQRYDLSQTAQTETTTTRSISIYDQDAFEFAATDLSSKQPIYADASRSNGAVSDAPRVDLGRLEPLSFTAQPEINYGLEGASNFFNQRFGAFKDWLQASVPFNVSWQTTRVNTGNPRLDQYVYQPLRSALDTVGNIGFNTLKTAGNAVSLVGNSPALLGGVVTGDYEGSQRFYDGAVNQLMANPAPPVKIFGGALTALNAGRVINKTTGAGRMAMAAERGAVDLRFVDTTGDVPVARMDSSIPAITATERVASSNLVYNKIDNASAPKVPFVGQMRAGGADRIPFTTAINDSVRLVQQEALSPVLRRTFMDSQYATVETITPITLFRKFGGSGNQAKANGAFATTVQNASRSETAVFQKWSNQRFEAQINVPEGNLLNIGKVAPQMSKSGGRIYHRGGGDQVLLPQHYPNAWIQSIKDGKTGTVYNLEEFQKLFPDQFN